MPVVDPDYAFELFKGGVQLAAVTAGVFAGFMLNSRFQIRNRLNQARSDWAAAAELCVGAFGLAANPHRARSDSPVRGTLVGENITRHRLAYEALAQMRAATAKLLLLDLKSEHHRRMRSIEDRIIEASNDDDHDDHLDGLRGEIRGLVVVWAAEEKRKRSVVFPRWRRAANRVDVSPLYTRTRIRKPKTTT